MAPEVACLMARDWRLRHLIETVTDHSYGTAGSTHGGERHREVDRLHVPDSHPERVDAMPIEGRAIRQVFMWLYGAPLTDDNVREVVCSLWKPYSSTAVRYLYRVLNSGFVVGETTYPRWETEPRR